MSSSPEGRWGGGLTRRALPEASRLGTAERNLVARAWQTRGASERRVADSFGVIACSLERLGAPRDLVALATRAIDDELRHAAICQHVASRYAGTELAEPERLPLTVPRHAEAEPRLRDALFVVGQCCFNETFASVVLESALTRATDPLARVALRELLSDEIDHARIGWAFLGAVSPTERRAIEPWLGHLARTNVAMWIDADRTVGEDALTAFGVLTPARVRESVMQSLRDLVAPGLEAVGLRTDGIRAYLT